jgi:hypothetical protein
VSDGRPWQLVAPAYRWTTAYGRNTAPVFQKYDTADPVSKLLENPARSLEFTDEDLVYSVGTDLNKTPEELKELLKRRTWEGYLVRTDRRKLFLDTHKRFYLVVCELHCDGPGFPSTSRDQVCEAGLVVRRRRVVTPRESQPEAARLLRELMRGTDELTKLHVQAATPKATKAPKAMKVAFVRRGATAVAEHATLADAEVRVAAAEERLLAQRDFLGRWFVEHGGLVLHEGWAPHPDLDRVGAWQSVAETPSETGEAIFPLYPLVPDPRDEAHPAAGKTIYFGVVPTAAADTDERGAPRFDSESLYEIRCFVRRHKPHCPRLLERNDCHGELVWSRPTETYRLAEQFDLVGTSNRPLTVQLPDIPALLVQAASLPNGPPLADSSGRPTGQRAPAPRLGGAPVRAVAPPASLPEVQLAPLLPPLPPVPTSIRMSGGQFCSFSIPLVTIVAMFVLNLFLPILMLLFGLFPLLKLKICLPMSAVDAAMADALDVGAPPLPSEGASVTAGVSFTGGTP